MGEGNEGWLGRGGERDLWGDFDSSEGRRGEIE